MEEWKEGRGRGRGSGSVGGSVGGRRQRGRESGSCRLELRGQYSRPRPVQFRGGGERATLVPLGALPRTEVPNPAKQVLGKGAVGGRRGSAGRKGRGQRETVPRPPVPAVVGLRSALCALLCARRSAVCSLGCNAVRSGSCVRRSIRPGGPFHNQSPHIRSAGHDQKRRGLEESWKRLARRSESTLPRLRAVALGSHR